MKKFLPLIVLNIPIKMVHLYNIIEWKELNSALIKKINPPGYSNNKSILASKLLKKQKKKTKTNLFGNTSNMPKKLPKAPIIEQ